MQSKQSPSKGKGISFDGSGLRSLIDGFCQSV